jgi:hypothetical protein
MKLFGLWDCRCGERAAESGIHNPLVYWGLYRPGRLLRRALWRAMGAVYGFDDHLTILEGHLTAKVTRANGLVEHLDLGKNTITDAAVAYLVDDFDNGAQEISTMNWHAWGTGACTDPPTCPTTTMVTEAAEARVAGTRSQPSANQYRTVAEITSASSQTITEWALMSASTSGTAWSLRCWVATGIALGNGDKIEFTYTLTINCVTG